jgi:hypothetical protein
MEVATKAARPSTELQPLVDLLLRQHTMHITGGHTATDTTHMQLCPLHDILSPCLPRLPLPDRCCCSHRQVPQRNSCLRPARAAVSRVHPGPAALRRSSS